MIPEIGHFALVLALVVAVVQGSVPLVGAARGDAGLMEIARTGAVAQLVLVAIAFAALTHAYLTSDFSLANVVQKRSGNAERHRARRGRDGFVDRIVRLRHTLDVPAVLLGGFLQ